MNNSGQGASVLFLGYDFDPEKLRTNIEHTVMFESAIADGLQRVHHYEVDGIVSEYQLQDGTAIDLVELIRDEYPQLPFILWTADGNEEIASQAITAGVTDYVIRQDELTDPGIGQVLNRITKPELAENRDQWLFDRLFEICPTGITVVYADGGIIRANDRAEEILGVSSDEIADRLFNDPTWEITDWDGEPIPPEELPSRRAQQTGEAIYGAELRVQHPNGERSWLLVNSVPVFGFGDDNGGTRVVNTFENINTHGKDGQLIESERKFRAIFEEAFDAILITNDDAEYIDANPAACELFGLDRGELLGRSIDEFAAEDYDFEGAWREFQASDQNHGFFPLVRADGEQRIVEFAATPDILPGRHLSVLRDVTERRRIEDELNEVFGRVTDAVHGLDTEWRFTYLNDYAEELLGRTEEELRGKYVWDEFPDALERSYRERYERAMETQETIIFEEYSDAAEAWLEVRAYPSPTGLSIYFRDISERKERERELERYETIVETVDDGVYAVNENGRFVLVNDAFCTLTGYEEERLLGQHVTMIHDEEITPHTAQLAGESGDGDQVSMMVEFEIETKTGERIPVESRVRSLSMDDGVGKCGVVRDITERKEFEQTITALYNSAHELLGTETKDEVSDVLINTITDILDISGVVMYLYDDEEDNLYPSAQSVNADFMREEFPKVPADASSITGSVYTTGEPHLFDDITESPHLQTDDTQMRAGIFVPIGTKGILVVGSKEIGAFDEQTQQLVELIGVNAETVYNRVENLSQLKERERLLKASEEKFRSLVETAPDPIFVADTETGEIVETNTAACEIRGQSRDEILGLHHSALHPEEEADRYKALFEKHIEQGGTVSQFSDGSPVIFTKTDGERIPVAISAQTVELDDRTLIHGIFRDISDQKRYEQSLEELNHAARDFLTAETDHEIAQSTIDIASNILDLSSVTVYFYNEEKGVLTPAAYPTTTEEFLGEPPTISPGDSIAWRVYTTQAQAVFDDVRSDDDVYNPGTPIRSELIMPLGEHGIFLAGDPEPGAFDALTVDLAKILTTTAETALDRIDWARQLQEQERDAQLHARRLERVNQINEKIRSIIQAIVHAETRPEIEQAICDALVEIDRFEFAWIGTPDFVASELQPSSWTGPTHGYLESITLDLDSDNGAPSLTAARQRETIVESNIAGSLQQESWRQVALLEDFRSVISVPILHDEVLYGVLTIYGHQPAAFDDRSSAVLTDLGELIGYALNAVERRSAFHETGVVELTFDLSELEDLFISLASGLETDLEIRNITPRSDGSYLVYLLAQDVDPDRFRDEADNFTTIIEVRPIGDAESGQFELIVSDSCLLTDVGEFAPIFQSIRISEQESRIAISLPQDRDVRPFVAQLRDHYPDLSLVGRQDTEYESTPLGPSSLLEHLTTRQQEVLKAAYYGGFFDQPRKSTGSEIAESLGISQPAFSKQLRNSERKLLKPLYEPE